MTLFNLASGINILLSLGKVFFLIIDFIFIIFLFIALRQFIYMNKIINDLNDSPILKSIATLLLIFAISLFLTALVIL